MIRELALAVHASSEYLLLPFYSTSYNTAACVVPHMSADAISFLLHQSLHLEHFRMFTHYTTTVMGQVCFGDTCRVEWEDMSENRALLQRTHRLIFYVCRIFSDAFTNRTTSSSSSSSCVLLYGTTCLAVMVVGFTIGRTGLFPGASFMIMSEQ